MVVFCFSCQICLKPNFTSHWGFFCFLSHQNWNWKVKSFAAASIFITFLQFSSLTTILYIFFFLISLTPIVSKAITAIQTV